MTGWSHINPALTIPITIGSYPISDQPPNYAASLSADLNTRLNGIRSPPSTNSNSNIDANANANVNLNTTNINTDSGNEQVMRSQPTAPTLDDVERTPAEPTLPYPHNGEFTIKCQKFGFETRKLIAHFVCSSIPPDPPSYEQAIMISERKFTPNYPVYRRQTSYSSQTNTPVLRRHCNP